jgi:hypothetical protein
MTGTPVKSKSGILLWVLAFFLMLGAYLWQRGTGPRQPLRGSVDIAGQQLKYSLPRSAANDKDAAISIPDQGLQARLLWKRYPTDDPETIVFMAPQTIDGEKMLVANIDRQDAAGKVEYRIEIGGNQKIPANAETVVMRFRGPVPAFIILPHALLMYIAYLVSIRTGLGAAARRDEKILPWATLGLILVGGLVLGSFVQKAAFGKYWTGWPFGYDLTDNKTLVMFIGWLAACVALIALPKVNRLAIILASLLTIAVYIIPHSARGSQLDYQQGTVETGH